MDSDLRSDAPRRGPPREQRERELRVFGVNACRAVFARRPHAIRKAYLLQSMVQAFKPMLADLAQRRLGYRIVEQEDLLKLTQSEHHEGVCLEVQRMAQPPLSEWLKSGAAARRGASLLLLLDGVGNPHNLGAVLRIGAHFAAEAVLLPPGASLQLSGAACRVAEGGAEFVPLLRMQELVRDLSALHGAGYELLATTVRDGESLYESRLPPRAVLMFGAEQTGMSDALLRRAARTLRIPGSGAVESLNIASAVAVMAGEFRRQHRLPPL